MGLRQHVVGHFFPFNISNYYVVLSFSAAAAVHGSIHFIWTKDSSRLFSVVYDLRNEADFPARAESETATGRYLISFKLGDDEVRPVVWEPGSIKVRLESMDGDLDLGEVQFSPR